MGYPQVPPVISTQVLFAHQPRKTCNLRRVRAARPARVVESRSPAQLPPLSSPGGLPTPLFRLRGPRLPDARPPAPRPTTGGRVLHADAEVR